MKASRALQWKRVWPLLVLLLISILGVQPSGTVASPQCRLVADIRPGEEPSFPSELTSFKGAVVFKVYDGQSQALWAAKAGQPNKITNEDSVSAMNEIFAADNLIYFSGYDHTNGLELWSSDGTGIGTQILANICPDPQHFPSDPHLFIGIREDVFFVANDCIHGTELWKSDGTTTGTVMVKDITPGWGSTNIMEMVVISDVLYFNADDNVHGWELWKTDGTAEGTTLVKDIGAGLDSGGPSGLYNHKGMLVFAAGDMNGMELWQSDGTEAGTQMIADIRPEAWIGSSPGGFKTIGDSFLFSADDGTHGRELWVSNGTASGTVLVRDVYPGTESSNPSNIIEFQGQAYFSADDGEHGQELWVSDGNDNGTQIVKNMNVGVAASSGPFGFVVVGQRFYFSADDGVSGRELWASDGTAEGTTLVANINPGEASSEPSEITFVGGWLYLKATDAEHGSEPWVCNELSFLPVILSDE